MKPQHPGQSGPLKQTLVGLAALLIVGTVQAQPPNRQADSRGGEVIDNRYNHGRYYPRHGHFVPRLPPGYRPYFFRGRPYYLYDGIWYSPGRGGFIVVRPPLGMYVSALPPYRTTVWLSGAPYYYADETYYRWAEQSNTYEVVAPPVDADRPLNTIMGDSGEAALGDSLFIYAKDGQSAEQQAADRYECHTWSKNQTGFNPTQPGGGVTPEQTARKGTEYTRATTACLEARGYSVR
jgi:hypothetical protein